MRPSEDSASPLFTMQEQAGTAIEAVLGVGKVWAYSPAAT
jgi:hypothetical protein